MCGCLPRGPLLGTWSTTQACALTGNRTSDSLVHWPSLNPLSHASQGKNSFLCWTSAWKYCHPFDPILLRFCSVSLPSLLQLSKFLSSQVPIVIQISLGKNKKKKETETRKEHLASKSWEREGGGEAQKPQPGHLAGFPDLRCGQPQSAAQVCHYFLVPVPQEGFGRPPLPLTNPQLSPKAACSGTGSLGDTAS